MSLQVGASCFATASDAGRAACSFFVPQMHVGDTTARTISCVSADTSTGALNLQIASTDLATNVVTYISTQQLQDYPPCVAQDYIDSLETITGALLALWVVGYSAYKILSFINWSRADNA